MTPLESYLKELREIRSSGEAVPETSYYGALATLFNEIGSTLKPKVRCITNIKNRGAGLPDGGFFTPDQFSKSMTDVSKPGWGGQIPARGVLEVKSTAEDVWEIAKGKQVLDYLGKYNQVLVTNYRDFLLLGRDLSGKPTNLESYRLADSEPSFWEAVNHPRKMGVKHEKRFTEYLLRILLSAAELRLPENLAWLLASYARDARERIEVADLSDLADLRDKLQAVLGITFGGEEGEHFFRSTLVQTIFYGIFAAWVLWSRETLTDESGSKFDWRVAGFELRVPILGKLFEQVATRSTLEDLGLIEVLNWTGDALNRVNRTDFFQEFEEKYAVQYFYEPFLEAFDPQLRKRLAVWYTPPEIVEYMVERADRVLREELDEPDGFASDNVYVLDPCCGTGAYLVEVLRRIERTLLEKGEDALIGEEIKKAAMKRVFGFEILPASFVISHLEVSAFSHRAARVSFSKDERPAIYLTNALTGWETMELPKQLATEKRFQMEWEAANKVKRDTPILVIIGNPPYYGFAGVSSEEEESLSEPYKKGLRDKWKIKKPHNELYMRFFRLAERRIAEMTGRGIVCYISNFS
ncbi:MAG: N-6 DNA methylase [Desulfomonilaceae bacterium]